jgi:L-alanine-DL-glutamate epimerase-like enolase superfamily enzyme
MVTIRQVELLPFAIPLRQPLAAAYGPVVARRGIALRLTDAAGRCGIGEATPHPADPPEALWRTRGDLERAATWLVGGDAGRLLPLPAAARDMTRAAAIAIDIALHDLVGHATGRSIAELLGGARRATVAASALLGADAAGARTAAADGFRTAKVKIGPDAEEAVRRVAALRATAPALGLRCDANGAWDAATATAVGRRLAALGIGWLEQPVAAGDVAGLARVRRLVDVIVAADEAVTGAAAVDRLAAAADAVVIKLVQVGGLAAAQAAARAAARAGLRVTVTSGLETGIATAAALHLAAAIPGPIEPCGVATSGLLAGDLLVTPLRPAPSMIPPRGPGLGIALDPHALARWRA